MLDFGKYTFFANAVVIACIALATSCSRRIADEEAFIKTYTEIIITREQFPDTAQANAKVAAILKQSGFTEASFRQHFQDLAQKPEFLRQVLDSARTRARRIGEEEQKHEKK
jgi:hypothetical protein